MMKNKHVLSGIPVILLAFALVFSACENGTTEVEGAVDISSQEAPVVTANAVKGGVLLEWNPIIGASYSVWRKAGNAEAIQLSSSGDYTYQNKETGKLYYLDLVSDTNALTKDTEYTYTVVASGSYKTIGKTEVKATPTDIPAKGTKLDPVKEVTLTLSPDTETISVSWTAAALPSAPTRYYVFVYRDSSPLYNNTNDPTSLGETKTSFDWSSNDQTEGEYAALVIASVGDNIYFKYSDAVASEKQEYVALFGSSGPSASGPQSIYNDDNDTLTGFSVSISISAKAGATYAVERAPVDAAGNAGTYTAVATLYKESSCTTAASLTADVLGLLPTVYDKLSPTAGKYKYRVKATKQGVTSQTREISSTITVDPRNQASVSSISIAEGTEDTEAQTKTYEVTPSLRYKNALQTGDKLVIYYVKGAYGVYQTGPYAVGVEFTKDQLEEETVEAKSLVIPKTASDSYAYVKAYLVFADGRTPQNVSNSITTGSGVSSKNSNYATLNY